MYADQVNTVDDADDTGSTGDTGNTMSDGATGEQFGDKRRRRRARTPADLASAVTSQRHSDRAARLPTRRRQQVVRFAEFFAQLYTDTGLTAEQIHDSIVLKYTRLYREDGAADGEALRLAESVAPGLATIKRLSSPSQMLSQSDVGQWRVCDVLEVCGSDLGTLAASIGFDPTVRERSIEHTRRAQAFMRLYNMLDEQDQDWIRQDMTRLRERRIAEAKARSAGIAQLDAALGFTPKDAD